MAHRITVSADDSQDPLGRMRVFQLAGEIIPDCFGDAKVVRAEPITEEIAGQLYEAVCSIEANISEAYSRSSGKERALRFEYALGSVHEKHELVQIRKASSRREDGQGSPGPPRGDAPNPAGDYPEGAGQDDEVAF